jgi:hypothetical protein
MKPIRICVAIVALVAAAEAHASTYYSHVAPGIICRPQNQSQAFTTQDGSILNLTTSWMAVECPLELNSN